jgi:hypothetical protein
MMGASPNAVESQDRKRQNARPVASKAPLASSFDANGKSRAET